MEFTEKNKPIGIFDSGLGGLTVLKALKEAMPYENFIYLGDVARLPYGTKSKSIVTKYALTCVDFLLNKDVKAIVVACNTATASALDELKRVSPVPVFGVIDPGARSVLNLTKNKRVLVAATQGTVKSEAYSKIFNSLDSSILVREVACPLLVPLAEEGWWDHKITVEVISHYLKTHQSFEYDVLLLGCTHYPLLEESFKKFLPEHVSVTHGAGILAQDLSRLLSSKKQVSISLEECKTIFYSTDIVSEKNIIPSRLFGRKAVFQTINL